MAYDAGKKDGGVAERRARSLTSRIAGAGYVRKWLVLGTIIGVVAGLGAVLFINTLDAATHLLLGLIGGYTPPSPLNEGNLAGSGHFTRAWAIPLVAGFGGLASGLLVAKFAPEAAGHGTDSAIAAVQSNPKRIRLRASVVKIIASALTIGSGGSGGREGPTAQISAGFASLLARVLNLSPEDARVAVTIGIGSGIGAIFRTPLGGAVLGAEVLYRDDVETEALVPGLIAAIVAFVVFGAFQGFAPIFGYQAGLLFDHPIQLLYYALIGIVAGGVGILYAKSFYGVHDAVERLNAPKWLTPAVGGLLVGCLALVFPQVLGTGYGWVQKMMSEQIFTFPLWLIILLPLARILATSLSIGSGGSGGIFGPGMVIGAFVGGTVWRLLETVAPGMPVSPAPFVIVGMMACFGSIGHIPFATMLMVAEMTGNLSLLAPAMVAVGLATLVVGDRHIYRAQRRTRADAPAHRFRYGLTPVGSLPTTSAMTPAVLVLKSDEAAASAAARLSESSLAGAPVVAADGHLQGIVRTVDLTHNADALVDATVGHFTAKLDQLPTTEWTLDATMELFALTQASWLPIVDDTGRLAGVITASQLLLRYRTLLRGSLRRLEALAKAGLLLDERVTADSGLAGQRIGAIVWPPETLVVSVRRGQEVLFATPATMLETNDQLTILAKSKQQDALATLLGHSIDRPSADDEADLDFV
ncbi:MAG: chloride channel protein [Thermoleophilia bacterium]